MESWTIPHTLVVQRIRVEKDWQIVQYTIFEQILNSSVKGFYTLFLRGGSKEGHGCASDLETRSWSHPAKPGRTA